MPYFTLKAGVACVAIAAALPLAAAQNNVDAVSGNALAPLSYAAAQQGATGAGLMPALSVSAVSAASSAFAIHSPEFLQVTDALLSVANAGMQASHSELDGLRAYRITQARNAPQSNVWGHYLGNSSRVNISSGAAYGFEQHGLALGADTRTTLGNGELVAGAFMTRTDSGVKHASGGTSRINSYGVGVYAGWTDIGGSYLDALLKGNRLDSTLSGSSSAWQQFALSTALEAGYRLMPLESLWVEPYARVSGVWLDDASLALGNGMTARTGSARFATVEVGVKLGTHFVFDGAEIKPYIRGGVEQTFASANALTINDSYRYDSNIDGTIWKYAAGASVNFGGNTSLYAEVKSRHGSHVTSPLQGIAGVRVSF